MDTKIQKLIDKSTLKKRPDAKVGDTVKLSLRIKEGEKERIQNFEGIVLAFSGSGASKNITVRKISYGVGVEKIVPLNSPLLEKLEVIKRGTVRRSKLYYMRGRIGKRALKISGSTDFYLGNEQEAPVEEPIEEVVAQPEASPEVTDSTTKTE
jgi:large subunit ribosomal protein L19